jgi:hypothetical protein
LVTPRSVTMRSGPEMWTIKFASWERALDLMDDWSPPHYRSGSIEY